MPLTRRLILSGVYDIPPHVGRSKAGLVPKINSYVLRGARCAYSAEPDFAYLSRGDVVSRRPELIAIIKGRAATGGVG
jgi:hypothetical protein